MNEWSGSIHWGWRDTGSVPDELKSEFDHADVTEAETYLCAWFKNLDDQTHTSLSHFTREDSYGRPAVRRLSDRSRESCGAFRFIGNVFTHLHDPRCEWVYVLFVNRMPDLHFSNPHYPQKSQRVANVAEGVALFGQLVDQSALHAFSECDWVLLKLIKGFKD